MLDRSSTVCQGAQLENSMMWYLGMFRLGGGRVYRVRRRRSRGTHWRKCRLSNTGSSSVRES
jgi:hypothetical protein